MKQCGLRLLRMRVDAGAAGECAAEIAPFLAAEGDFEVQALILARLAAIALGRDPKLALTAVGLLMEITGSDVRSVLAAEQQKGARRKAREADGVERIDRLIRQIDGIAGRNGEEDAPCD